MNTFLEIRTYKSEDQFKSRSRHNLRMTNLSSGPHKDKEFINLVKRYDESLEDTLKNDQANELTTSKNSRSKLTNDLSKYNAKLKQQQKELSKLGDQLTDFIKIGGDVLSKEYSKINNKFTRKTKTIENTKSKIKDLTKLRDNTKKDYSTSNKNKKRKQFIEIVLNITKIPKEFQRDKNYRDDYATLIESYIASKGFKFKKHSLAIHMDQGNVNAHLLAIYDGDDSITKDLTNIFDDGDRTQRKQYFRLNDSFNKFVRKSDLIKKRDWSIEKIQKGGREDYTNLPFYKELTKDASEVYDNAIKEMEKHSDYDLKILGKRIGVDYEKLYKDLRGSDFKDLFVSDMIRKTIPGKTIEEYEKIMKENKRLMKSINNAYNDSKVIEKLEETIKSKDNDINFYKKKVQSLEETLEDRNKKISELTPKDKSHNRNRNR